jgi:hypothetical protein
MAGTHWERVCGNAASRDSNIAGRSTPLRKRRAGRNRLKIAASRPVSRHGGRRAIRQAAPSPLCRQSLAGKRFPPDFGKHRIKLQRLNPMPQIRKINLIPILPQQHRGIGSVDYAVGE